MKVERSSCHSYDRDNKNLFKDEIQEWMATTTCPKYNKPQQMKLIGTVNGIEVEMSFDTLRKLAKFDSLPARDYMFPSLDDLFHKPKAHPRWNDMLEALFLSGTYHGTLYRKSLKIEAKLLLMICIYNVITRRGISRKLDSLRSIIPYCRIITRLLKMYKAITPEDKGAMKRHRHFDIRRMGSGWTYDESERYYKLKSEGQRWCALKVDARALQPSEDDEPESDNEPRSGDDDYADEPNMEHTDVDQGGPRRIHVHGGGFFDYAECSYEPNWVYQGTMQKFIENQRPPSFVLDTWSGSEWTFFIIKLGCDQAWSEL
ncbi:hypothetical protein Hdeb2414_s0015g00437491 [Helianthus debilis subsp. tardiflorus]